MCYQALGALVGGGVSAKGQWEQGKLDEAYAQREAQIGEMQAADALQRSGTEEERYRRQLAQIIGMQRTEIGNRNVATSGTALDLLGDTARIGAEDIETIRSEAARTAWGYRVGADESRRWGANARKNANAAAGSTLLTSGMQAYGMWSGA
jgi:hypothetical protein